MADQNEAPAADAGDALLDAFLGAEGQSAESSKEFEQPGATTDGEPAEAEASGEEEQPEAEAEAAPEEDEEAEVKAGEPDGDYVEHEGKKIAVGELLDAYKFKTSTESQLTQLRHNVISQANQHVAAAQTELTRRSEALDSAYEFLQTLVPQYERPPVSMLDPSSKDYNPDAYHTLNHQITQVEGRKRAAAEKVQQARAGRDHEAQVQRARAVQENAQKLAAEDPAWADPKTAAVKAAELTKSLKDNYGFDDATIASVVDYRFFKLAQDAAAYRASLAKGAPKPKEGQKAAPRLVRSTAKPSAKAPMAKRVAEAQRSLKKTGKVTDLEATFGRFVP